jgi:hypothetical protein
MDLQKIAPAIRGTVYRQCEGGSGPIVSFVRQRLKPGVGLADPAVAAGRIWATKLDCLSHLPGLESLLWGQADGPDTDRHVVLLLHWSSVAAWVRFQQCPGLSMLYMADLARAAIRRTRRSVPTLKVGGSGSTGLAARLTERPF